VEGQRHITLTGWDRKDYGFLGSKQDVVVLQMANPDVTDQTLEQLRKMDRLQELDLSNTQVTDAGLKILRNLPALRSLRLKNTRITDPGFHEFLAGKDSLMQLDLRGTAVSQETAQAWRKDRDGRRVLR
jgi:Ran GTPase-activating protein (RanGAP) involved in mRNA processing and transport